jgi:hypothetical protein
MPSTFSVESRLLFDPAGTFRLLRDTDCHGRWWVLVRRPLLLLLTMSCAVSMLGESRLSIRLIADAAVSFAFVPIIQIIAFGIVYRTTPRPIRFARAVDLFSAGNGPWYIWLIAVSAVGLFQSPRDAAIWTSLEFFGAVCVGLPIAAWALWIDLQFFRTVLFHVDSRPVRDLVVMRAITWSLALTWFFGIAAWPELAGRIWL